MRDPEFKIPNEMEERLLKKHSGTPVIGVKIIRYSDGKIECRTYPSFKPFSLDREKLREPTEKLVLKTRIREGKVSFEDDDVQFKYSNFIFVNILSMVSLKKKMVKWCASFQIAKKIFGVL